MKKIAIVTWIGGGNYGTSLQSFALHKKLEDLGYSVTFFSGYPERFTIKNKIKCLLGFLGIDFKSVKNKILFLLGWLGIDILTIKIKLSREKLLYKKIKLRRFHKENYNIANSINSQRQLDGFVESMDVFISGSDQIWNTLNKFDSFFFLDFAKDKKRISYASSMGITDFPEEHKPDVKKLLSKYQHIGVREKTAVKAISSLLGRTDIQQVVDPTFLLEKKEWSKISDKAQIEFKIPQKYLFCYLIGNNPWYKEQTLEVIQITGIKNIIIVPAAENPDFAIEGATIYDAAGPLEFIKLIKEATFVCTDSFHATALSLNMEVPFVEFMRFSDNSKGSQNSRIYDILERYNLTYRIYNKTDKRWAEIIDYSDVSNQINNDRKASLDFLVESIER